MKIRPSAVAGMFYPDDPEVLRRDVQEYVLANPEGSQPLPKAAIVPHAGYMYSGPVAGKVYAVLKQYQNRYRKVAIFGPAHRMAFQGVALPGVDAFQTPLGVVLVDKELAELVQGHEIVRSLPQAHQQEHCLEVQLPFIQETLKQVSILPLLVGNCDESKLSELMQALLSVEDVLVLVSSDLSHYLSYSQAQSVDDLTAHAIVALNQEGVEDDYACGALPIRALLRCAQSKGLAPDCLMLANSGDTAGGREQVVGYGAFIFHQGGIQ